MLFYFLPSNAQRRRRNGLVQPGRLYLADGTELKNLKMMQASSDEPMLCRVDRPLPHAKRFTKLTLEFTGAIEIKEISRAPKRKPPKAAP